MRGFERAMRKLPRENRTASQPLTNRSGRMDLNLVNPNLLISNVSMKKERPDSECESITRIIRPEEESRERSAHLK
jgi:hypothetical protein